MQHLLNAVLRHPDAALNHLRSYGQLASAELSLATQVWQRRLLLTAGALVSGGLAVGFIGLLAPHLVRLLCGPSHRAVLPGSALLGASLVLLADTAARTALAPAEMPLGVLTGLIGAPTFLWLLHGRANRSSSF